MRYFVSGTDTDVGKSVVSAWLVGRLGAHYWKPIQSGLADGTDMERVQALSGCDAAKILPPAYELQQPLSPHEAAKRDGVEIDFDRFSLPVVDGPLIVEGAGGLLVPLNDEYYVIDLIKRLGLPTILVCRSGLGTINHTLLSLESLRSRSIEIAGVVMVGDKSPHNREAIEDYGKVRVICEMPLLDPLTPESLLSVQPEISL